MGEWLDGQKPLLENRKHAFVTGPDGEGMTDLNSLVELENGVFLADAMDDRGQIIANASDGRAYVLSPVPEPQTTNLCNAPGWAGIDGRGRQTPEEGGRSLTH